MNCSFLAMSLSILLRYLELPHYLNLYLKVKTMFALCSDITIGKFRFSGVNEVRISKSIHSISDTAVIKLPSIAKVITGGKVMPEYVITGKQFNEGDPVTINLGYNTSFKEEFQGFVTQCDLGMPLEVTCEGYSWLLRRNNINRFWGSVSVEELLVAAVEGINPDYTITVQCDVEMQLTNIRINDESGFDVISNLAKYTDNCLTCFFIQPNVLWCGFVYTPFAKGNYVLPDQVISYKLGYNCIKDNNLKVRLTENDPVEVKYFKKLANGTKISATSDVYNNAASNHTKIINHAGEQTSLQDMANEKAYRLNYSGYEGDLTAFLQPYASPGNEAYITDSRYPERNGNYLIESTEVNFGINGARRILEIGPLSGFANQK